MRSEGRLGTSDRVWIGLFAIWIALLSGFLAGAPGFWQAYKLHRVKADREAEISILDQERDRLVREERDLTENALVQEREIRRVLGYTATNEIVFDFSGE